MESEKGSQENINQSRQNQNAQPQQYQPSVGMAYQNGWDLMWRYFPILLLILLVSVVISSGASIVSGLLAEHGGALNEIVWGLASVIFSLLIGIPIYYGVKYAHLRAVRGQEIRISHVFDSFNYFFNVILSAFFVGAIIILGIFLLIVPGIIFACKLAFVPYLVVDRRLGAWEAIQESWNMTRGYTGQIFAIYLLGIQISILGLIALGIGIIPATIWISLTLASFYYSINPVKPVVDEFAPIK